MYKQIIDVYTKSVINGIVRISDNTWIPADPANSDYQAYLRWLEEGNTPLPAEENQ
jgi:hypothetical protein